MRATTPPLRGTNEADVSTKQPTTQADTRLPRPHGHPGGAAGTEAPARQGPQAADGQHSTEAATLTSGRRQAGLPRTHRIRKRSEFLRLQRIGRRKSGARFVVITEPRKKISRLGITTSRHVGGAVVRNRVRRLVREFFRRRKDAIVPPQDVLVIARPSAANATLAEVVQELAGALRVHVEQ